MKKINEEMRRLHNKRPKSMKSAKSPKSCKTSKSSKSSKLSPGEWNAANEEVYDALVDATDPNVV